MNYPSRAVLAAAAAFCAAPLYAQDSAAPERSGPYIGASIGSFNYYEEEETFDVEIDDSTMAYRLFGGYQFNQYFAIEAGFGATDDIEESFTVGAARVDISGQYDLASIRMLGIVPLGKVSLIGGVGYYDADLTVTATARQGNASATDSLEDSENGTSLLGGLQVEFDQISLRGEYEWFDSENNVEAWDVALALVFHF